MIGRTAKELGVWADPEDRDVVIADLREHAILYDLEIRLRTKSGEVRECVTSLARIMLADTPCLVSLFSDVTDRKRTERALQASQDQLRQAQKLEAIGRLAGGIAHDFNNLLTIIIGYSDMLLNRPPAGDGGRGELEEVRKAGQQAAALTQQLLAFSRKQVLAPRILDLNAVIANLDRMLRRLVGEHIQLVTRLGTSLGPVLVDQAQIEQVIVNLAVNARDAMPTGGTLTIETENVELGTDQPARGLAIRPARSSRSACATRARAWMPRRASACSSRSSPRSRRGRAPASASRRSTASSSRATATSRSRARSAAARPSRSSCRAPRAPPNRVPWRSRCRPRPAARRFSWPKTRTRCAT